MLGKLEDIKFITIPKRELKQMYVTGWTTKQLIAIWEHCLQKKLIRIEFMSKIIGVKKLMQSFEMLHCC